MTRVLYVHGLESGPTGHKVWLLQEAGFEVRSVQMPCSRRHSLRDGLFVGWVAALGVALVAAALSPLPALALVVPAVGAASFPLVKALVTRRVFARSLEVQRPQLQAHPIDVVVGSSFGGAIAVELISRGLWSGPAVLLCPAHALVARRSRRPPHPGFAGVPSAVLERIVVVHGTRDETVPLEDSQRLVAQTPARLITVEDDHRLSATATAASLKAWVTAALP